MYGLRSFWKGFIVVIIDLERSVIFAACFFLLYILPLSGLHSLVIQRLIPYMFFLRPKLIVLRMMRFPREEERARCKEMIGILKMDGAMECYPRDGYFVVFHI